MSYLVLNASNAYDPNNQSPVATEKEADTRAREIMSQFPTSKVYVVQVLKEYSAKVTVSAKEPSPVEAEPDPESPT